MSDYEANAMAALQVSVRVQQLFLSEKLFQPIVVEIDKKRFMWDGIKNFHVEDAGTWNPLISSGALPDQRLPDLAVFLHCIDKLYEAAKEKRDSVSVILDQGTSKAETFLLQNANPYGGNDEEAGQSDQG
jgi:hypothetical protein